VPKIAREAGSGTAAGLPLAVPDTEATNELTVQGAVLVAQPVPVVPNVGETPAKPKLMPRGH